MDRALRHRSDGRPGPAVRWGSLTTAVRLAVAACLVVSTLLSMGQGTGGGTGSGGGGPAVVASRQANNVAVISISGEITPVTARSVLRRMALAERAGAQALVFELDTPGGDLKASLAISAAIKASRIRNTVAWVNRDAYSGGAVVAIACREIVAADPAALGDAIPIAIDPMGKLIPLPEAERQKAVAPLIADLVDSARRNGFDESLVQGIASTGVELWLVESVTDDPPRQMFITRAEYLLLFGEEPSAAQPRLVSSRRSPDAPAAPASGPSGASGPSPFGITGGTGPGSKPAGPGRTGGRGPRSSRPMPTVPPPNPNDPNLFSPASPKLEPLAGRVTREQTMPASRPVLTAADRGQWRLVEYVSSGDGPFVFRTDDMTRYSLASGVVTNPEELRAFFGARHVLRLDPSWSEGLVAFLTNRMVQGVLVVIFLIALFLEMTHPGVMLPGAVAFAALVGLLGPPLIINLASWWEVAAIVGGIVMIALEVLVIPGFGVVGVVGLLALFGGLIGIFVPEGGMFPDTAQGQSDLLYGVSTLVMAVATAGVGIYFVARHFSSLPLFNRLMLKDPVMPDEAVGDDLLAAMAGAAEDAVRPGVLGRTITPLRPSGRVEIGDRIVDVVAEIGFIPAGAAVVVTSVSEFRITVDRATDEAGGTDRA